jgi:hypothetical protein
MIKPIQLNDVGRPVLFRTWVGTDPTNPHHWLWQEGICLGTTEDGTRVKIRIPYWWVFWEIIWVEANDVRRVVPNFTLPTQIEEWVGPE